MRKTPAERLRTEKIKAVLYAALACAGAVFLTSLLFSGIASAVDLSDGTFTLMSSIALCAGCFAASFAAARRRGKGGHCSGIKTGLLCGTIIFAAVLLAGTLFVRSFSAGGFFTKALIILVCSSIGGIFGINARS